MPAIAMGIKRKLPPLPPEKPSRFLGVNLPTDMHTELRMLAIRRRTNVRAIVMELIREELAQASRRE